MFDLGGDGLGLHLVLGGRIADDGGWIAPQGLERDARLGRVRNTRFRKVGQFV